MYHNSYNGVFIYLVGVQNIDLEPKVLVVTLQN